MKAIEENPRELRGLEIVNKHGNQIKRIDDSNYEVLSQSGNGSYLVSQTEDDWICECPDHRFRNVKCCKKSVNRGANVFIINGILYVW